MPSFRKIRLVTSKSIKYIYIFVSCKPDSPELLLDFNIYFEDCLELIQGLMYMMPLLLMKRKVGRVS